MQNDWPTLTANVCGLRSWTALRPPSSAPRSTMAFTLIEMMVVTGMIAILMGVAFSGLGQARNQARIVKANTEIRELVNAILSYETAEEQLAITDSPTEATREKIGHLLGEKQGSTVYLNAQLVNDAFRDPWGTPYRYRILKGQAMDSEANRTTVSAAVTFPNRQREIRFMFP